ncbi:Hypothetical protein D9617_2g056910 [Elsinoe fawcettii]|nr:Hypothetical protein D9617_2g056910 [Elsinoe fawcettii]
MKVSALAVGAVALVPAVAAQKAKPSFDCITTASNVKTRIVTATNWADTTTKTIQPKTTVTQTVRTPVNIVQTVTAVIKKKTTTATAVVKTNVKETVTNTVTSTITAAAVTISPDPTTATVATPAGFTGAVSALATVAKRDAAPQNGGNKKATLCVANFAGTRTIKTTLPTTTITKSVTKPGKTNTTTKTVTKVAPGVETITVTATQTKTQTITAATVVKTTIKPTVTLQAETVNFYAACADFNLLDYTLSTHAPSSSNGTDTTSPDDGTSDGGDDSSDDGDDATTRRMRRSAKIGSFPTLKLTKRATYHVGINAVAAASGLTPTIKEDIDTAYDCCAVCQSTANCAGSAFGPVDGCVIYTGTTCPANQGQSAGSFTYDSQDPLEVGSGEIVSNGLCGTFAFGGEKIAATDDSD